MDLIEEYEQTQTLIFIACAVVNVLAVIALLVWVKVLQKQVLANQYTAVDLMVAYLVSHPDRSLQEPGFPKNSKLVVYLDSLGIKHYDKEALIWKHLEDSFELRKQLKAQKTT